MNELQQQDFFDYGLLPINDVMELNAIKERVRIRLKRTAEDIIEIGKDLIIAKEKCGHGNFERWLSAEFDLSVDTAQNFIKVANTFGSEIPNSSVFKFSAKALYLLSAPSTPELVRAKVLEDAENGIVRTIKEIEELKKQNAAINAEKTQLRQSLEMRSEMHTKAAEERNELKQKNELLNNQLSSVEKTKQEERENNQKLIDAKIAEGKMQAILDNQNEIQRLKNQNEAAEKENARIKKQYEKNLTEGVAKKLSEMQVQINQTQFEIDKRERRIAELIQAERELDVKVGAIARHKKAIQEFSDGLEHLFFKVFSIADDCDKSLPQEIAKEWLELAKKSESMTSTVFGVADKISDISPLLIDQSAQSD